MKSYTLTPFGSGKIASALCKLCAEGKMGEPIIRSGCSQSAVSLFAARLAKHYYEQGYTPEQVADVFDLTSTANASAFAKALASCTIQFEGEKPTSLETHWGTLGGRSSVNLAILGDLG